MAPPDPKSATDKGGPGTASAPAAAEDKQAFVAGIAAQHGRRLRRYLAARLRNSADVPDMAQEVYLRLLRVNEHEMIRSPEAYLFTVASHVLYQHTLRQSTTPPAVEFDDAFAELAASRDTTAADDPATQVDIQQRLQELDRALEKLPAKAHAALVLHRRDGFTIEEISDQLGVSRPMAKKYLARALLYCRQHLGWE